ncbi:MAG: glycosyltransferase family 4 protein [Alicyclobacillus sp.]|nr:glycosyltransferase family 4 protein [Alicyclobacillus sp.]
MFEIAYVSTYVPRKCGLATYTHHLRQSIRPWLDAEGGADRVIAMLGSDESGQGYDRDCVFLQRDRENSYAQMAQWLNRSTVDVVSLQHEFGIFGGEAGEWILRFARALRKPLVTTFHTVFEHPEHPYREIQEELIRLSDHVTVMNRRAVGYLVKAFGVSSDMISFIPHGTPGPSQKPRDQIRRALGWNGRRVVLTFGLLGPGKGIESIIEALPHVVREIPEVLYVIAGQTHPEIIRTQGETYRMHLQSIIHANRLDGHVTMINRYLTEEDIVDLITACDLYVTPYPGMQQITSGTLAYAVGAGCPVLSTPYAYAQDLLHTMPDLLIPYGDSERWAHGMIRLLSQDTVRQTVARQVADIGRSMHWLEVGRQHLDLFMRIAGRRRVAEGSEALVVTR